jgi:type IV secretion system protein VirB4
MAIYEEFLPWYGPASHLSDVMPWRTFAAPGVLLHKQTHALQRSYLIRGPDLSSEVREVQGALMLQANEVFKRLRGTWTVHCELQRAAFHAYESKPYWAEAQRLIDAERRRSLLEDPGSYESRYVLTLTWQPPGGAASLWHKFVLPPAPPKRGGVLGDFLDQADYLVYLLRGMLAVGRPLTTDETLTYLHDCVSDRRHPVRMPWLSVDVDSYLCDRPFRGGWYPYWGTPPTSDHPGDQTHLRVCSIRGYPAKSVAEIVQQLNHLAFPYRWVTRWVALDRRTQDDLLVTRQKHQLGQRQGVLAQLGEFVTGKKSEIQDTAAELKAEEADAARQEVGFDVVAYGDFTAVVVVWDRDEGRAEEKIRDVMQVFESRGFTMILEREHATAMWLASVPGNRLDGVRRAPINSLTFAHLAPGLSAAWPGEDRDAHLQAPPWFYAHTEGSTAFRVVNHVQDNGHFFVPGPTRTGKSVLLALMNAQWGYTGGQCFPFDVDGSMRCLTHCMGGQWVELGAAGGPGHVRLQPLRHLDDSVRRARASEWVLALLQDAGVEKRPGLGGIVDRALDDLATLPAHERTLTRYFYALKARSNAADVAATKRKDYQEKILELYADVFGALSPFIAGGIYAGVLDGDRDDISGSRFICFEQRTLVGMERLKRPVLRHVFATLEDRFDTRTPTLVTMDEFAVLAAVAYDTTHAGREKDYAKRAKEWLMTKAKKNVSLGFATHSLAQIFGEESDGELGALILEGCKSTYALPNPAARTGQMAAIYRRLGYNESETDLIARARAQRDVYYRAETLGSRLLSLRLSPLTLAVLARNRQEDHERMDKVLEREGPEGFLDAWLREQGFPEAAERLLGEVAHAAD